MVELLKEKVKREEGSLGKMLMRMPIKDRKSKIMVLGIMNLII